MRHLSAQSMWEHSHRAAMAFLQTATEHQDPAELDARFLQVLGAFGFDRFSCTKLEPGPEGPQPTLLAEHGLQDWHRRWIEQNYLEVDPVAALAKSRRPQFTWSEAREWSRQQEGRPTPKEQQLWAEAAEAGMGDGLVTTAYGPGGEFLVFRAVTPARSVRPADRPLLEAIAIVYSTLRLRLHERELDLGQAVLTLREQQCLRWASQGLGDTEIAEQLAISVKTVAFHMENAKRKLGARTRLAAYRRALELGCLAP